MPDVVLCLVFANGEWFLFCRLGHGMFSRWCSARLSPQSSNTCCLILIFSHPKPKPEPETEESFANTCIWIYRILATMFFVALSLLAAVVAAGAHATKFTSQCDGTVVCAMLSLDLCAKAGCRVVDNDSVRVVKRCFSSPNRFFLFSVYHKRMRIAIS